MAEVNASKASLNPLGPVSAVTGEPEGGVILPERMSFIVEPT